MIDLFKITKNYSKLIDEWNVSKIYDADTLIHHEEYVSFKYLINDIPIASISGEISRMYSSLITGQD
jgi:hypothetical protein